MIQAMALLEQAMALLEQVMALQVPGLVPPEQAMVPPEQAMALRASEPRNLQASLYLDFPKLPILFLHRHKHH